MSSFIAVSKSYYGGPCQHCHTTIQTGDTIVKITRCCNDHEPPWKQGAKNGPGVWLCQDCAMQFLILPDKDCAGKDPTCPCQDGDPCHYEGENPMTSPTVIVENAQGSYGAKTVVAAGHLFVDIDDDISANFLAPGRYSLLKLETDGPRIKWCLVHESAHDLEVFGNRSLCCVAVLGRDDPVEPCKTIDAVVTFVTEDDDGS